VGAERSAGQPAASDPSTAGAVTPRPAVRRWWPEIQAVFIKDCRSELRRRSALFAILLFAATSLAVLSFTVPTQGFGLDQSLNPAPGGGMVSGDTRTRSLLLAALFWVVLFFSAVAGMARSYVKEEEGRTVTALRLAARPLAVYFGKLLFNLALLLGVAAVVTPLFLVLFQPRVADGWLLAAEVALGTAAMAASATILGAIVARAGAGSPLFAALAFPVLFFVLALAIHGTAGAFQGGAAGGDARNQLPALVSYLVAMATVGAMVIEQVWNA
jgi:heme exporter protein B